MSPAVAEELIQTLPLREVLRIMCVCADRIREINEEHPVVLGNDRPTVKPGRQP